MSHSGIVLFWFAISLWLSMVVQPFLWFSFSLFFARTTIPLSSFFPHNKIHRCIVVDSVKIHSFFSTFPMRTHVPLRFTMLYGTFLRLFACVQQTAVFTIKGKHTNKNNNTINYLNGLMKTSNDFSIKLHTHRHTRISYWTKWDCDAT